MNDLQKPSKRIQILYTFVTNFESIQRIVREMALSGDMGDYIRAEGICDVVGSYVYGMSSMEEVMSKIKADHGNPESEKLIDDLFAAFDKQMDSILMQMNARHQMLLDILLLRSTIHPTQVREGIKAAEEEAEASMSEEEQASKQRKVKLKRGIPIEGNDLKVLNQIASANLGPGDYLSDFSKQFKTPRIRDIICRLYYQSPYHFEQAFSNTDVNVQFILLEILREDRKKDQKNQDKKDALDALQDLHILATIDTSANKMTSKVSDHQAFELLLSALGKSNNDFIIRKLLNDDIIMTTMFDISTRDLENYYGFRRMFTTAKYPYDGWIVEKYKKLKKLTPDMFSAIIRDLSRDQGFKSSWENYLKTEKTKGFIQVVSDARSALFEDELSGDQLYSLCYVLDEFTKSDQYNHDLLTFDLMLDMMEDIYWFIIRTDTYGQYEILEESLQAFYAHRVRNALNANKRHYKDFGYEATFGISPADLWFDIHGMMKKFGFTDDKFYLNFGGGEIYMFQRQGRIHPYEKGLSAPSITNLPKGEQAVLCNSDKSKGFDQYVFNLYGRILRNFMGEKIHTKLLSLKQQTFRKIEIPGLSVKDDQRIRKVVTDYMTLLFLWEKDKELFLHVYSHKIAGILHAMTNMEKSYSAMIKYVTLDSNPWVLTIFNYKGMVNRMSSEWEMIQKSGKEALVISHGDAFFELGERNL